MKKKKRERHSLVTWPVPYTVRLDVKTAAIINKLAKASDVSPGVLMRQWIMQIGPALVGIETMVKKAQSLPEGDTSGFRSLDMRFEIVRKALEDLALSQGDRFNQLLSESKKGKKR